MESRYSPVAFSAFELFFLPWLRTRLHRIVVQGSVRLPPGRPVVLAANHTSWWDGFLLRDLQRRLRPRAPLYTVMLERELRRHRYFRWMGALPLDPGSPASLRALLRRLRAERARTPEMMVAFFPQGRLWPSSRRPLGFRPGVAAVVRALAPATVLPVGLHLEPHDHPAPTAYVVLGEPVEGEAGCDPAEVERRVEDALDALARALTASDASEHAAGNGAASHG